MSKAAVIYWSGTGNTGLMANAVLADPEGLIVHELPDEEGLACCEELGKRLAAL